MPTRLPLSKTPYSVQPVELLIAAVLLLHSASVILRAAQPAPPPWWPSVPEGRTAAAPQGPPVPSHNPGLQTVIDQRPPQPAAPASGGRARRRGRGASRRGRGRRGGVNWGRHGDTGDDRLIIGQLNIQSLKPKLPDLRNDIYQNFSFDILALSECWLQPNIPDRLLTVNGYTLYRRDRPDSLKLPKGKGGVAVLVRNALRSELLPTPVTGINDSNLEIIWVRVHLGKGRSVLVASVYRVPVNTMHQKSSDLDDLEQQLQFMIAQHPRSTLLVCGDMNLCLLKAAREERNELEHRLSMYNIHVTNRTVPTYRPASSLLDIIATNRPDLIRRAGVTRCHYGGPHDFSRVILANDKCPNQSNTSHIYRRAIARVDPTEFNLQLRDTDWTTVYNAATSDDKWHAFQRIFIRELDVVAPMRRLRQRRMHATPVSADTQRLLQLRRGALSRNDRAEYVELNRLCRAATRRECVALYSREISEGRRGGLWRVLRPVIGRRQESCSIPNVTPDALNDYFASIGPTTASSVPRATSAVATRLPRVPTSSFRVQPIDFDTLCITLGSMRPSKSTGLDGISIATIQKFFFGVGLPLLDIVNSSLTSGHVPKAWKHALVTPIPKGKVVTGPADTRPISILPAITKLAERIVQRQLTEYLEQNYLFSDAQHGYRKHFSTETALHVITDSVLHAMDNGEISIMITLDLSKCFDVVPHSKLLEKLSAYGIHTDWFRSYLEGHTQQVRLTGRAGDSGARPAAARGARPAGATRAPGRTCTAGGAGLSRTQNVSSGIFQGGALSCVLYALYSNDLSSFIGDGVTTVCYADDSTLLASGRKRDIHLVIARLEAALNSAYQWFCHNGMKVNARKTQMLVLGTPAMLRGLPPVSLNFCGTKILDSRVIKSLGVSIDRHLTYHKHIDSVTQKCTGILMALSHARHVIPRSALKVIVECLAVSVVRYCLSVYGSCGATQVHRIQKILNFCARVVTGRRRYDHISDAIEQLGWMNARQMVTFHAVCAVSKVVTSGIPELIAETICPPANEIHDHHTRRAGRRTLPQIRTEAGRRRLCYRGVDALNALGITPGAVGLKAQVKGCVMSRGDAT